MAGNSPTFRQAPSNLVPSLDSRPYQAAEQPVWLDGPSVSGYCSAVIPAQDLWFKWGDRSWTLATQGLLNGSDIPRTDLRYMFNNERLIRQPIKKYVPWITTPALTPLYPVLNYACCNWTGPLFGSGESVLNMRWHLAYVNNIGAFNSTITSSDNAQSIAGLISANQVPAPLDTTDSHTESGGVADPETGLFDDPGSAAGWVLCLMHHVIKGTSFSFFNRTGSYYIEWHCFGAYQLHPENQQYLSSAPSSIVLPDPIIGPPPDNASPSPMFNCLDRNLWVPIHNPLNFPAHLIQTRPIGP